MRASVKGGEHYISEVKDPPPKWVHIQKGPHRHSYMHCGVDVHRYAEDPFNPVCTAVYRSKPFGGGRTLEQADREQHTPGLAYDLARSE